MCVGVFEALAYCVQEDCLSRAHRCYSLARLVALQLSVLQSGRQVINLDVKKVHKYMEELPFQEVGEVSLGVAESCEGGKLAQNVLCYLKII